MIEQRLKLAKQFDRGEIDAEGHYRFEPADDKRFAADLKKMLPRIPLTLRRQTLSLLWSFERARVQARSARRLRPCYEEPQRRPQHNPYLLGRGRAILRQPLPHLGVVRLLEAPALVEKNRPLGVQQVEDVEEEVDRRRAGG